MRLSYLFIRLRLHSHFVSLLMFQQSFSFFEILFDVVIRVGFLQSSSYVHCLVGCWQPEKFAFFVRSETDSLIFINIYSTLVRFLFMTANERDSPQNSSARAQSASQWDESQSNNDSQTETQPLSHFENRNNSDRKLKSFRVQNRRNKKSWGYKGSFGHDVHGSRFNDTLV